MKIVVDAFGGDHAPLAVMQGSLLAKEAYPDIKIILTGDQEKMMQTAQEHKLDMRAIKMVNADSVITADDDPLDIRSKKKDCSMAVGFGLLRSGEGDAFVSAGSTAALAVGSSTLVQRIKGIKRAALAPIMPSETGAFMLLDAGATLDCRPEMLLQFAVMGSIYAKSIMGIETPRVGLANIGTEEHKGNELLQQSYQLLKESQQIHFVGNVEARDIPGGCCDVVVADGMSGNMILKSMEGMGLFFVHALKDMLTASLKTKIAAGLLMGQIKQLKKQMDYAEYGGAVLMGICRPVVKAHGSSDAKAFFNAIRQAHDCVEKQVPEQIMKSVQQMKEEKKNEDISK